MKRVLVVSPHPDDEAVGCGGTLLEHAARGDRIRVIFLTSGEGGGHGRLPEETAKAREEEARAAAVILGIRAIEFWRLPDGQLRATRAITERLLEVLSREKADVLYVPHGGEEHADHRAGARLVVRSLALLDRRVPEVWTYEVWTPLARMERIVDITPYVRDRERAIRAYRSQCSVMRFDDAFRGLARYRGEMFCWPKVAGGGRYAEVFGTVRR